MNRSWITYIVALLLWCAGLTSPVVADQLPFGLDTIVFYNSQLQPIRKITGLPALTGCATLEDASVAITIPKSSTVTFLAPDGAVRTRINVPAVPISISPSAKGVVVVLDNWQILEMSGDGTILHSTVHNEALSAVAHPQTGVVVLRRPGVLQHLTWEGTTLGTFDAITDGKKGIISVLSSRDATAFTAIDAATSQLFVLDLGLREVGRLKLSSNLVNGLASLSTERFVMTRPASEELSLLGPDGLERRQKVGGIPSCLSPLIRGEFVIGFSVNGIVHNPTESKVGFLRQRPPLSITSLASIIVGSFFGALLIGTILSLPFRKFERPHQTETTGTCKDHAPTVRLELPWTLKQRVLVLAAWLALATGAGATYLYIRQVTVPKWVGWWEWSQYAVAAVLCAVGLSYLNRVYKLTGRLATSANPEISEFSQNRINWLVVILVLGSVGFFHFANHPHDDAKMRVALWITAQVLIPFAWWSGRSYARHWSRWEIIGIGSLCCAVFLSRVVWMGSYPDEIHGDFGNVADGALRMLTHDWRPFFSLDGADTIGRPWLSLTSAFMWLFGVEEWTFHLSSALWMTILVYGCFLLGRELVSSSFGWLCGFLVGVHHTLLMYSRQPYVTESNPPFVLALYFLVRAFRSGAWRDWTYAGLWIAWAMTSIRQFTKFPFIWIAMLLCLLLLHFRCTLARLGGIVIACLTALMVFAPFYPAFSSSQLVYRLNTMSPLFVNGTLSFDLNVWRNQLAGAFGSILVYPDAAAWPSQTGAPICLALSGPLFAVGLFFLLLHAKSFLSIVSLTTIFVGTILGSAFLPNPPGYYHQFVAIIFVLFVVAIPLEILWRLALSRRSRLLRSVLASAVAATVFAVGIELSSPFLRSVRRSVTPTGEIAPNQNFFSALSDYMLTHRDSTYIFVNDLNSEHVWTYASMHYGDFVTRAQLNSPLTLHLPIRPASREGSTTFMAFGDDNVALRLAERVYPGGVMGSIPFSYGRARIGLYTVPNITLADRLSAVAALPEAQDVKPYQLVPVEM